MKIVASLSIPPLAVFDPGVGKGGSESEATIFIRNRYVMAIEAAGGIPVILPVITGQALSSAILDRLDGLVLTGSGPDIDPRRYGERSEERRVGKECERLCR